MTTPHVPLTGFGPGVIGEEAAAAEAQVVKTERNIFGPGVLGDAAPGDDQPAEPAPAPGLNLSVTEMEKQLKGNPTLFEEFLLAELNRPLPRKTALQILLEDERKRPGARPEVITLLEQKLVPAAT